MDCVFLHRKSTHFNFTYVLFHNQTLDLNGDSFSWLRMLKLKRAKREGGRGTAACSQSINAFLLRANLLKRVLEESVCAYVGSGRSCSSADLTFSRPVNQQTPRTPRETANEGKKWSEQDEWNSVCCLNDSSLYTLFGFLDWMWSFDMRQQSIMSLLGSQGVDPSLSVT